MASGALHVRTSPIGLPYARADVDARGYFVTCPICGAQFVGTGRGDATKNAGLNYALHFEAAAKAGR